MYAWRTLADLYLQCEDYFCYWFKVHMCTMTNPLFTASCIDCGPTAYLLSKLCTHTLKLSIHGNVYLLHWFLIISINYLVSTPSHGMDNNTRVIMTVWLRGSNWNVGPTVHRSSKGSTAPLERTEKQKNLRCKARPYINENSKTRQVTRLFFFLDNKPSRSCQNHKKSWMVLRNIV